MANYVELEKNIKSIIDDLKGLCSTNGLSNTAGEEIVVTSVFLYKFLNDKFISNLKRFVKDVVDKNLEGDALNKKIVEVAEDEDMMDAFYDTYPQDVAFHYEDTIDYLVNYVSDNNFFKRFDDTLVRISNYEQNDDFGVDTAEGTKKPLFIPLTDYVEPSKRNSFVKSIFSYITRDRFDFGEAFESNYDFFSTIFEYLISDYNVASGKYAEYFTPQALSKAIAQILVRMSPVEDTIYDIYDPSAGSGSLVLHLANELGDGKFGNKARVYTQDISQKSSRFLRINMLLNGLKESLANIIEGDTLLNPSHFKKKGDSTSGLKKFDFITSNPPFNTDFSSTRDDIETNWSSTDRFFAGIPNVPKKKKESMAIYLCFIQHILYSLKEKGKAAIIVPTGFITAQNGIEKEIRQTIVDRKWLRGVISMPEKLFANTGTNVSVIFIDKTYSGDNILLIDATKLGKKVKVGNNQKTILSDEELALIVKTFVENNEVDGFSSAVTTEQIQEKHYSWAAGQYFRVDLKSVEITAEEFNKQIGELKVSINDKFNKSKNLEDKIRSGLEALKDELS